MTIAPCGLVYIPRRPREDKRSFWTYPIYHTMSGPTKPAGAPARRQGMAQRSQRGMESLEQLVVQSLAARLIRSKSADMARTLHTWRHPVSSASLPDSSVMQVREKSFDCTIQPSSLKQPI